MEEKCIAAIQVLGANLEFSIASALEQTKDVGEFQVLSEVISSIIRCIILCREPLVQVIIPIHCSLGLRRSKCLVDSSTLFTLTETDGLPFVCTVCRIYYNFKYISAMIVKMY